MLSAESPFVCYNANPITRVSSATLDPLGEGRFQSDESSVRRELPAVIHLMCDSVMEPRQPRSFLSVETEDQLEHVDLSGAAELLRTVAVGAAQRGDELALRSHLLHVARVVGEHLRPGVALEIRVLARQLSE